MAKSIFASLAAKDSLARDCDRAVFEEAKDGKGILQTDANGLTVLHYAAKQRNPELAIWALQAAEKLGFDARKKFAAQTDATGKTAAQYVEKRKFLDFFRSSATQNRQAIAASVSKAADPKATFDPVETPFQACKSADALLAKFFHQELPAIAAKAEKSKSLDVKALILENGTFKKLMSRARVEKKSDVRECAKALANLVKARTKCEIKPGKFWQIASKISFQMTQVIAAADAAKTLEKALVRLLEGKKRAGQKQSKQEVVSEEAVSAMVNGLAEQGTFDLLSSWSTFGRENYLDLVARHISTLLFANRALPPQKAADVVVRKMYGFSAESLPMAIELPLELERFKAEMKKFEVEAENMFDYDSQSSSRSSHSSSSSLSRSRSPARYADPRKEREHQDRRGHHHDDQPGYRRIQRGQDPYRLPRLRTLSPLPDPRYCCARR